MRSARREKKTSLQGDDFVVVEEKKNICTIFQGLLRSWSSFLSMARQRAKKELSHSLNTVIFIFLNFVLGTRDWFFRLVEFSSHSGRLHSEQHSLSAFQEPT